MGSLVFFFFFFFFKSKLLFLVLNLFFLSLLMSVFILMKTSSWLGGLFFLIYMGAVLVVIYYVFSLSSNLVTGQLGVKILSSVILGWLLMSGLQFSIEESKMAWVFKDNILAFNDGFFFFFSLILFSGLWVSTKFQLFKKMALRIFL